MKWLLLLCLLTIHTAAYSQAVAPANEEKKDSVAVEKAKALRFGDEGEGQYDFGDLTRNILHPGRKADPAGTRHPASPSSPILPPTPLLAPN